jgi:hypothetical protein
MTKSLDESLASDVILASIECREVPAVCRANAAGSGGWPTIKTFTKATGAAGSFYTQKQQGKAVCDELKVVDNMKAYVNEAVVAERKRVAAGAAASGSGEL